MLVGCGVLGTMFGVLEALVNRDGAYISVGLSVGLVLSAIVYPVVIFTLVMGSRTDTNRQPSTVASQNREHRWTSLAVMCTIIGVFAALFGLTGVHTGQPAFGVTFGAALGGVLGASFLVIRNPRWQATVVQFGLAIRCGVPLRLSRFLEDAADRGEVRANGLTW
jgi:hypothetical protein